MAIPTYVQGYPQDGSSLGASKVQIRNNLDGTFQTLGVDHINNNGIPGNNPAGYHNVVHMVTQGSDPSTITNITQAYSKTASIPAQTELFVKDGAGNVFQLTGKGSTGVGSYYWTGGLLFQMGVFDTTSLTRTGNIELPIEFPNNFINLQLTMKVSATTNHDSGIYYQQNPPNDSFTWFVGTTSSSFTGFSWLAIGN